MQRSRLPLRVPPAVTLPFGRRRQLLAVAVVAVLAAGCGGGGRPAAHRSPTAMTTATVDPSVEQALRDPRITRALKRCDVTQPNHSVPPGETPGPGQVLADYHGNRGLWTVLPSRGVLVAGIDDLRPDGSIARKFPWWRGPEGQLQITGRRLDHDAPELRARIPSGYGSKGFQSSALIFPTVGCWGVSGSVGSAELTFVTLVVKPRAS